MSTTAKTAGSNGPKMSVRAGALTYETRPMPIKRAQSYARMIEANRRHPVAAASIHDAGKKGYVVCWLPASALRQCALFDRFQAEQWDRAQRELETWNIQWLDDTHTRARVTTPDVDGQGRARAYNTYEVNLAGPSCTCPQQETRCTVAGAICKHLCGALIRAQEEPAAPAPSAHQQRPLPTPRGFESDEAFAAAVARDFG